MVVQQAKSAEWRRRRSRGGMVALERERGCIATMDVWGVQCGEVTKFEKMMRKMAKDPKSEPS